MGNATEIAKDFDARQIERQGMVNLWGRSWKAETILALKDEHTSLSAHFAAQIKALPNPVGVDPEEYEAAMRALDASSRVLDRVRERMCRMALHPTCPKAEQSARGGGRPRKARDGDPVDVTPMPIPEVSGPEPAPGA